MTKQVSPNRFPIVRNREQVKKMFNAIAGNYDLLNKVISWRMDKRWRNKVLEEISKVKPDTVLDIATGTADMAILLSKTDTKYILAIDISPGMLVIANKKIKRLNLQALIHTEIRDVENINVPDHFFDAATVAYGIRNYENLEKGLAETLRVLKPGGVMVILETSVPSNPILKFGYVFYVRRIMPMIAGLISKNKSAYTYLAESAINFPYGDELVSVLKKTGFRNVKSMPQMWGISTIYCAEK